MLETVHTYIVTSVCSLPIVKFASMNSTPKEGCANPPNLFVLHPNAGHRCGGRFGPWAASIQNFWRYVDDSRTPATHALRIQQQKYPTFRSIIVAIDVPFTVGTRSIICTALSHRSHANEWETAGLRAARLSPTWLPCMAWADSGRRVPQDVKRDEGFPIQYSMKDPPGRRALLIGC